MRDEPLTFTATPGKSSDICIFRLEGPLTLSNMFSFQKALGENPAPVTIIDLTECPYMDSAGLGSILNFYVSTQRAGRSLRISGVNSRIMELFKLTKVDNLLQRYPTVEDAEAA